MAFLASRVDLQEGVTRPAIPIPKFLHDRELSADHLLDACEARIEALGPLLRAIPTLDFDRARSAPSARGPSACPSGRLLPFFFLSSAARR
jgi:Asp-tRNA(Asn)/Glu-tRNA(Gln) amidotransferase A subunit family amidase